MPSKIEDASEGERKVSLTLKESLKVLSEQMVALLRFCSNSSLLLSAVPAEYLQLYGHALRPQMYERASLEELMDCIKHVVEFWWNIIGNNVVELIRRYIEKLRVGYRKAGDLGGMAWEDPSGVREELVRELIRPVDYPWCEKNVEYRKLGQLSGVLVGRRLRHFGGELVGRRLGHRNNANASKIALSTSRDGTRQPEVA
uniref:HTH OST-type domain-containing protein n=1 Tax=Timema douglasi TaxID=61478 RepID=A0A7R8V970_TIMDO|nr:unnamed protein product [Timema douglasi]